MKKKAKEIYICPDNFMCWGNTIKKHILDKLPSKEKEVVFVVASSDKEELIKTLKELDIPNKWSLDVFHPETRDETIKRVRKIIPYGEVPSNVIDESLNCISKNENSSGNW